MSLSRNVSGRWWYHKLSLTPGVLKDNLYTLGAVLSQVIYLCPLFDNLYFNDLFFVSSGTQNLISVS